MPIQYASRSLYAATGTSPTVNLPSANIGDVYVAFYVVHSATLPTAPSGWKIIYSGKSASSILSYVLCYVVNMSTPSAAFTHTGSVSYELSIVTYSGVHTEDPILITAQTTNTSSTANPTPPSISNTVQYSMAVIAGFRAAGASNANGTLTSNGYTLLSQTANASDSALASRILTATGTETPPSFTNYPTASASDIWAATILLRPSNTVQNTLMPLISTYRSADFISTTATKSVTINANAGDMLILQSFVGGSTTIPSSFSGGAGITWAGSVQGTNSGTPYSGQSIVTSPTTQTFTLTGTVSPVNDPWGFVVLQFMQPNASTSFNGGGRGAIGTSPIFTATIDNSYETGDILPWTTVDVSGANGSTRTYYTTIGPFVEILYGVFSSSFSVYAGYYTNLDFSNAPTSATIGISSPSTMSYSCTFMQLRWPAGTAQYINPSIGWF